MQAEAVRDLARLHLLLHDRVFGDRTNLAAVLTGLDIRLIAIAFPDDPQFSGVAVSGRDGYRAVLVNLLLPAPRRRFAIAHQVGHLALEHGGERWQWAQEREANLYASELLLPARRVLRQWSEGSRSVAEVARRNGVSRGALIWRLRGLGMRQ